MRLALQDGQQYQCGRTAKEDGIPVVEQMMRSNCGCYGGRPILAKSAASLVVMCSITTFNFGKRWVNRQHRINKCFLDQRSIRISDFAISPTKANRTLHFGQRVGCDIS